MVPLRNDQILAQPSAMPHVYLIEEILDVMLGEPLLLQHKGVGCRVDLAVHADDTAQRMCVESGDVEESFAFVGGVALTDPLAEAGPAVIAGAMAEVIAIGQEAIDTDVDRSGYHALLCLAPGR